MSETRTIHDPFHNKTVEISDRLTDRLRGRYARGPTMPNGEPEFGWATHEVPSIQHEAAARIEALEADLKVCADQLEENTTTMDMARARIEQLEAQLNDNSERYGNAIAARIDELEKRVEQLEADLKVCADRLEENTATMDMARTRIEQLEAALREIKDQLLTSDQASAIARAALTPKREENDDVFKGFRGNNDNA
jgi:chromosome segregation ATPase